MQASATNHFLIYTISERALSIEFGQIIDELILQRISSFNKLLWQQPFTGLITTVPAYTTLSIFFDPLEVMQSENLHGSNCYDRLTDYLQQLELSSSVGGVIKGNLVTIPVCYGGNFGPDLKELAAAHQLTEREVIDIHSSAIYTVFMIGFVPGFAYLGGMPLVLDTPRKATPRNAVTAGSVGIAGKQTGVYPLQTPGGWQIIGRTPLSMFKADRQVPALLKAGDQVKFDPVSYADFKAIA